MTPLSYCLQFRIMTRIFYSWDRSIFQYQTMRKYRVELSLVYKTSINKHTCETPLLPQKTNCIHCSHNTGFFWELSKVIFPLQPKTQLFGDILPERVLCSAAEWSALMGALLISLSLWSMRARTRSSGSKCPYKEFHPSWRHEEPWSKKTFWNL